jgi:hypothetical protein
VKKLIPVAALAVALVGCAGLKNLMNPSSPQSGQALAVVGAVQSMSACIQEGVKSVPKNVSTQVHADAVTNVVTACVTQFEPEITAAALGAIAK